MSARQPAEGFSAREWAFKLRSPERGKSFCWVTG